MGAFRERAWGGRARLAYAYLGCMYKQVTGVPAPIKRHDRKPDPQLHQLALEKIVAAAGHGLATKASAYIFSSAAMRKLDARVVSREQVLVALAAAKGNKSHVAKALGISRQALYRVLSKVSDPSPRASSALSARGDNDGSD